MSGSIEGNIIGTLYFLAYQLGGILLALRLIKSEKMAFRVLIGSVLGSVGVHWCPILFSFMFDFTVTSHICGLVLFALIILLVYVLSTPVENGGKKDKLRKKPKEVSSIKDSIRNYPVLIIGVPLFIFFCMMLWNHTIVEYSDGSIHTGQCTFGDMNMHLGFITSIVNQQTFPPYYSILPDTKLAYPFLSDAISSSVYVWGASLKFAYMLPMWIAVLQALAGMYMFASEWLKSKYKAFLAFVLFFFNGGFGIIYFLDGTYTWDNLFNGFYNTPTNLVDVNVKWTNVIVDMLLPQRATLFGWALLFPLLCLVHKAWNHNKIRYFLIAAFAAGALPMIHTHSFLALGIICFGWMIADMAKKSGVLLWSDDDNAQSTGMICKCVLAGVVVAGLGLFSAFSALQPKEVISENVYLIIAVMGVALLALFGMYCVAHSSKEIRMMHIKTWGVFLGIVLIFAVPQLLFWTFKQVSGGGMLHGHFNWANEGDVADPYMLFYLKNIGLVGLLFIPSFICAKKRDLARVIPALIIWFICELVVFQPNTYDNNKLLLVAYMLICCFVAGTICDVLNSLGKRISKDGAGNTPALIIKCVATTVIVVVCSISAVLTMAREYNSGRDKNSYELYSKDLVDVCKYIEENTPANSVILTANNHNNAVASLTGRNIVCGTSSFLFYHGLDYYEREASLNGMYSDPVNNDAYFKKYGVDYVLVSGVEYGTFSELNESALYEKFTCEYSTEGVRLYRVK
ncbi:MAG: hypothetical protein E7265_08625 [Lachnospiraceae bacterium]|nr:hypothetical protein [Lachnospiraceae bacterium]